MRTEWQIREAARQAQLQVKALDWLEGHTEDFPKYHSSGCNLEDPENIGPCNCGYKEKNDLANFIKNAILTVNL